MKAVLRFFRRFLIALLCVGLIISTKWIFYIYFADQNQVYLSTAHLNFISWYVITPLLILLLILKGVEQWVVRTGS